LNELLHNDLPADRFITFALALLDQCGEVQLISAGHGPTLLHKPSTGESREFGGDGMPLGVSPIEDQLAVIAGAVPNSSIERTVAGKPPVAAQVKR
jgi:hypothetical protein